MSEALISQTDCYQELLQSICQEFGSAKVEGFMAACFGKKRTRTALEKLKIAIAMTGIQLVPIYNRNRSIEGKGENYNK